MRMIEIACLLGVFLVGSIPGALHADQRLLTGDGYDAADPCHFTDWFAMASYLDHMGMAQSFLLNPPPLPHDPPRQYLRAVTFDPSAGVDSLGLDAFLKMSTEARQARSELAARYRVRVGEFYNMIHKYLVIAQEGGLPRFDTINNRSVTDCIRSLTTATGVDPADASAWYDLASFTALVGDWPRSLVCLNTVWQVLQLENRDSCPEFRQRVALDAAWVCRDLGLQDESLAWVSRARAAGADATESSLVEGLALADRGQFSDAIEIADSIEPVKTRKRRIYSTANPWAARLFPSDYAKQWVKAMAFLRSGDIELALHMVALTNPTREYPQARRFWTDIGLIHELAGRSEARGYYGLAITWSPYLIYYPLDGIRGAPRVLGQRGTGHGFFRSHQSLYLTGSLFAYAATTAVEAEITEDTGRSEQLAGLALEAMDICRRRGIRPASALAMRGRFLFARDDFAGAYVSLQTAIAEMAERGRQDAESHLFAGLAALRIDLPEPALLYLTTAVELDPTRAVAWNGLGAARDLNGDPAGARAAFDRSIALAPESALTWFNRGLLNYNVGDREGAVNDLQVALQLDPQLARAAALLQLAEGGGSADPADLAFDFGDSPAADVISQGERAVPRGRNDMSGLEEGLVAVQSGMQPSAKSTSRSYTEEEVEALARLYRDDPSRTNRRSLAEGLIRVGRPEEASDLMLPFWSDAAAVDEHTLMLEADRALGETDRARELVASLKQGPPEHGTATLWALVAFICLDAGLKDEGMAALDAAISLDPENTALKRHRSLLSSS